MLHAGRQLDGFDHGANESNGILMVNGAAKAWRRAATAAAVRRKRATVTEFAARHDTELPSTIPGHPHSCEGIVAAASPVKEFVPRADNSPDRACRARSGTSRPEPRGARFARRRLP